LELFLLLLSLSLVVLVVLVGFVLLLAAVLLALIHAAPVSQRLVRILELLLLPLVQLEPQGMCTYIKII
jgi:hypothetical protein